ncbi:hypothetical protein BDFB_001410, partial [Asbolus verrucosus]
FPGYANIFHSYFVLSFHIVLSIYYLVIRILKFHLLGIISFECIIHVIASICVILSIICMSFTKRDKVANISAIFNIIDSELYAAYRCKISFQNRLNFMIFQIFSLTFFLMEACFSLFAINSFGLMIASSCSNVMQSMKQAAIIGFELMLYVPLDSNSQEAKSIEEDLIFLETVVINRLTNFVAAGFFTVDFQTIFAMLSSVSSVVILCFGLTMASSCSNTVQSMKQAAIIGFELLLDLPVGSNSQQAKNIEEGLVLLETIITNRLTRFSAAGFFAIDFQTIFAMLSSVSSVVI